MDARAEPHHDLAMTDDTEPERSEPEGGVASDVDDHLVGGTRSAGEQLRRHSTDRMVWGVSGGLGRYFEVDPLLFRVAFVVLAFLGGSGAILYVAAWALVPRDGEAEAPATRFLGSDRRITTVVAVVLVVVAIAVIPPIGWGLGGDFGLVGPLLLIAAGVYLLVFHQPSDSALSATPPGQPSGPPSASAPQVTPPSRRGADAPPPPTATATPQRPPADAVPPPAKPRPRSFLTPLTLSVIVLAAGVAILLDKANVVDVSVSGFLAVALAAVGVALLASVWWGRARGLIVVGVLLTLVLAVAAAVDIEVWSGVGQRTYRPETLAELDARYELGAGELVVDLRDLDIARGTHDVEVRLTVGEVRVYVPDDVDVSVDAEARVGQLEVFGENNEGLRNTLIVDRAGDGPGSATLNIDLEIGAGHGIVDHG